MTTKITRHNLAEFLSRTQLAVLHLDANWDVAYRSSVSEKMDSLEKESRPDVSFGYVDVDAEQEFAREVGIKNVPAVLYYRGGALVASIIGADQDIAENIERVRNHI